MFKKHFEKLLFGLIVLLVVSFCVALVMGRYQITFSKVFQILWREATESIIKGINLVSPDLAREINYSFPLKMKTWTKIEELIVMNARFPRVVLAILIGAGLSVSGVAMQALFSNPLVSPHILGVSYGAGFGAALGILFFDKSIVIQGMAIAFGMVAIFLTYSISRTKKGAKLYMLVLSGVIVGSLFQAFISFIKYVADPEEKLPTIVYWLMGSFSGTAKEDLFLAGPLIGGAIVLLFVIRWQLNVLSLSEEEAISMGVSLKSLRRIVVGTTTVISAVAVSLCGIIGFVGLVIPHFSRMIVGSEHRKLMPVSLVIGGIYLLIIDTLSRTITAAEIPISILTAIVGAPFFAFLLRRTGGN